MWNAPTPFAVNLKTVTHGLYYYASPVIVIYNTRNPNLVFHITIQDFLGFQFFETLFIGVCFDNERCHIYVALFYYIKQPIILKKI